jgi:DNA polymerase III subunit epsilon
VKLKLTKPLVFIDIETTGINVASDRIVEISIHKVNVDETTETKTMRINPGIPIPIESSKIHGIYDKDVEGEPLFSQVAQTLANFIDNADIAGYNSNKFDIPLLAEEFLRAEVDFDMQKRKFVDVQVIFHKMEQRTLVAAYQFYCNKNLENAHSAEADTLATYEVLLSQLDKYPGLENNVDFLSQFSAQSKSVDFMGRIILDENNVEIFNFGKFKGKPVAEVFRKEPSYYSWMMNGDFPLYTKKVITAIKIREFGK